jgi:bifunctional non-homologous end joining protein LigD
MLTELAPMQPDRRVRAPLSSHSWIYELKLTGLRVRALVDGDCVALLDEAGIDCAPAFPQIPPSLHLLRGDPHVLDGVCTTQASTASHAPHPAQHGPSTLCLFDLLFHDGRDVTDQPLLVRKQLLFDLVGPELPSVIYTGHFEDCGRGLWQAVGQLQLSGLMARRKDSAYWPGRRCGDWRVIDRITQGPG